MLIMEEQDECCHALNNLRRIRKMRPSLSTATQAAQAQAATLAPPGEPTRNILDYTSESYNNEQNYEMHPSFFPSSSKYQKPSENSAQEQPFNITKGKKLEKVIDSLLNAKRDEKSKSSSPFSIDHILRNKPTDLHISPVCTQTQGQNHEMESNRSSEASSLANLSDNSFKILHCHSDERTPLSMKKAASNSLEFRHLGTNESHSQNGKNYDSQMHCIYSSSPNDPYGNQLRSFIELKKKEMTLDIQQLAVSNSFEKINEMENSQLSETFEKQKFENWENSTQAEIEKTIQDIIGKNPQMNCLSKNGNTHISQNTQIAGIQNWQDDNYKIRSSNSDKTEAKTKIESPERDITLQCPTLYSILNEKAIYKNGLLIKPWDKEDIIIKKEQPFNQATINNSPISFSPCNLDGTTGIFHGNTAQQETEVVVSPSITNAHKLMENKNPTFQDNPVRASSTHPQRQEKATEDMARCYTFRDGQHPYTAIFISFAPPSAALAAAGRATQTAAGANACRMGASAAAAHVVLTKIAQRPPNRAEYKNQLRNFSHSFLDEYDGHFVPDVMAAQN